MQEVSRLPSIAYYEGTLNAFARELDELETLQRQMARWVETGRIRLKQFDQLLKDYRESYENLQADQKHEKGS